MPPVKPLQITLTKIGTEVHVNVTYNSNRFIWIKAITVHLTGGSNQGAWTLREGDPVQGFANGRHGLLDPGSGAALFAVIPGVGWAVKGTATAVCATLSQQKFSNTL